MSRCFDRRIVLGRGAPSADGLMDLSDIDLSAYWQEPDFLLAELVSLLANRADSQLGITLLVKGAILTGTLVGERDYLNRVNTMFKQMARELLVKPTKDDLASIDDAFGFDELVEDNYTDELDADDEKTEAEAQPEAPAVAPTADKPEWVEPSPIRHLHLKDPVLIYPGATLSFTESALPILRIRLAAIDGWMLGRISVIADDVDDQLPDVGFIH